MTPIRFTTVNDLRDEIFKRQLDPYIAVVLGDKEVDISPASLARYEEVAQDTDATICYSNYRELLDNGSVADHPLIDYQPGSLRDNFDFGSLVLLNVADVLSATEDFNEEDSLLMDGGWYSLRLRLSMGRMIALIPEYLYTVRRTDNRMSGEKQHDYVNPSNREYQKEMERCLLNHLWEINGILPYPRQEADLSAGTFPVEASVIIPVRNRYSTIADAVRSALSQQPSFDFNVIVVDNGSSDGTSEILESFDDPRLIVISLTGKEGLGIGGCWNLAVQSEHCGRFAVQLDSDDLYSSPVTLQAIVDKFYEGNYAMVIGSYTMTDFNLNPIPPGLISHDEWTPHYGADNALRINGLGAPRAFFTPVIRAVLFPNVSYGEDYAVALRISREYQIGRIFESLYFCRRWQGNSDAALSVEQTNRNDYYKDFLRSVELIARVRNNGDLTPQEPDFDDLGISEYEEGEDYDEDFDDEDFDDEDFDDEEEETDD